MKKTIVFVLVMALCVTALSSCAFIKNLLPGNNGDDGVVSPVTNVANMYKMSSPTKIVATTKQSISSLELNCSYELITGYVDNRPASVYTVSTEEIRTVEDGGNTEEVKDIIKKTTKKTESIEGTGSRTNGGEWDPSGSVWVINKGGMALNLKEEYMQNVKYNDHTLTFTVSADNAANVLGESYAKDVASDVRVTIVDDGAVIASIELHYFLKGDESINLVESEMNVKVVYTYDLERITIE
jgi:hypothetical protein